MGCNCEADLMQANSDLAKITEERDGLLRITEAFAAVMTPEQMGEARQRLADRDAGL
jgi:hypothetical protein